MTALATVKRVASEAGGPYLARALGRSLWSVLFTDGRVVSEWERDWLELPKRGAKALRLYAPNGEVAELGNTEDSTGRLFQFKCAVAAVGAAGGATRNTLAHVIGRIDGTDGQCACVAWEYATDEAPGRLLPFRDNVYAMQYRQVGRLSADALAIEAR